MMKRNFFSAVCVLGSFFGDCSSSWGQEFVSCQSMSTGYTIAIRGDDVDDSGKRRLWATVTSPEKNSVAYEVEFYSGPLSISNGRMRYFDLETGGKIFQLLAPSTNFRHYSLHLNPNQSERGMTQSMHTMHTSPPTPASASMISSIHDDDLECSLYQTELREVSSREKADDHSDSASLIGYSTMSD